MGCDAVVNTEAGAGGCGAGCICWRDADRTVPLLGGSGRWVLILFIEERSWRV